MHGPTASDETFDVAVVGAGVVGSAIARELSGYRLRVALLDAADDVGDATSKANTAILHTGFDATPSTLEARLVRRGAELLRAYAKTTGIPVERTGAMLVAWTAEQRDALGGIVQRARKNAYGAAERVDADEVYRRVPALGPGAHGGVVVPDESITCTWSTTLALATDAVLRGTQLLLGHRVDRVDVGPAVTMLHADGGTVAARWVVNAAGLGADVLDDAFGHERFTVTPRRGELIVFDKLARTLVDQIVLAVPTARGKGVLISPTVYGNVVVGPTAEDLTDRTDTGTSEAGLAFLFERAATLVPSLLDEEVTATYAGLRAASDRSDYLVEVDTEARYAIAAGIRSTGLTSAMAVAEHLCELLDGAGLVLEERRDLPDPPQLPNLSEALTRPFEDAERIAADPAYGEVVCFCERVSAGELRDAFSSTIPPVDLGGLRRRTRVMNGRCQGFYCGAAVTTIVERSGGTVR